MTMPAMAPVPIPDPEDGEAGEPFRVPPVGLVTVTSAKATSLLLKQLEVSTLGMRASPGSANVMSAHCPRRKGGQQPL